MDTNHSYLVICSCNRQTVIYFDSEKQDWSPLDYDWQFGFTEENQPKYSGPGWFCGREGHRTKRFDHSVKQLPRKQLEPIITDDVIADEINEKFGSLF